MTLPVVISEVVIPPVVNSDVPLTQSNSWKFLPKQLEHVVEFNSQTSGHVISKSPHKVATKGSTVWELA